MNLQGERGRDGFTGQKGEPVSKPKPVKSPGFSVGSVHNKYFFKPLATLCANVAEEQESVDCASRARCH